MTGDGGRGLVCLSPRIEERGLDGNTLALETDQSSKSFDCFGGTLLEHPISLYGRDGYTFAVGWEGGVHSSKECAVLLIGEDARVGMDGWMDGSPVPPHPLIRTRDGRRKERMDVCMDGWGAWMRSVGCSFVR